MKIDSVEFRFGFYDLIQIFLPTITWGFNWLVLICSLNPIQWANPLYCWAGSLIELIKSGPADLWEPCASRLGSEWREICSYYKSLFFPSKFVNVSRKSNSPKQVKWENSTCILLKWRVTWFRTSLLLKTLNSSMWGKSLNLLHNWLLCQYFCWNRCLIMKGIDGRGVWLK